MSAHTTVVELTETIGFTKPPIFLSDLLTENVWQLLFYEMMSVGVSVVVPGDVFGLTTHPRHGLREKSQMVRCRLDVKTITECSRVHYLRYRQKPRQNLAC